MVTYSHTSYAHMHMCARTHTHMHTCSHAHMHTCSHAHTHMDACVHLSHTISDLPGPPRLSIARDSTNLTILVQLSEVGSPPLIQVVLVVTTLNDHWLLTMSGSYLPGDCVPFTLSVLANEGDYMFAAYAVNFAGQGPSSPQTTYPGKTTCCAWCGIEETCPTPFFQHTSMHPFKCSLYVFGRLCIGLQIPCGPLSGSS